MVMALPGWLRVVRGMIGTGFTFAVGVGLATAAVAGVAWMRGLASAADVLRAAGRFSVAAFLLGVGFSGVLALVARRGWFKRLSVPLTAALGAGVGVVYFALISINGIHSWTPRLALGNFVVLTVMGAGAAVATLLIARQAGAALGSADTEYLAAGEQERTRGRRGAEERVHEPRQKR
jgi:hypothetical protein